MGTFTLGLDVSPERNLSRYLNEIRKFPMLAAEEELALARSWRDRQDIEASHKLVTSHLRLVVKIATGYKGYGLPLGELIAEGNTNTGIAEKLSLSVRTVETHRAHIMSKLRFNSQAELVRYAVQQGLVAP